MQLPLCDGKASQSIGRIVELDGEDSSVTEHDLLLLRRSFMRRAVELGKRSVSEADDKPSVGVVVVKDDKIIGESFRGATGEGRHAEFGLIAQLKADGVDLTGATVYSTLEPCSKRNHPKIPCALHLVEAGVAEVYIGIYDPNPTIYLEGWKVLRDNGIKVRNFDEDFRAQISQDNNDFIAQYRIAIGDRGSARFDFTQNSGRYDVQCSDNNKFVVNVTDAGPDAVYFLNYKLKVAHLKHAREFEDVDDPGAYDWSNYTHMVAVGGIGAFANAHGYLLVKVTGVKNQRYGASHTELAFDYEFRPKKIIPQEN